MDEETDLSPPDRYVTDKLRKFKDSIIVGLIPLKIVMFLWWGASGALFAFMSVHMKALGLNVFQTGVIYSSMPASQVLGQVAMGYVADRFKCHRLIVLTSLVLVAAVATSILYIPRVTELDLLEQRNGLAFYLYLTLRLVFEFFNCTIYCLFESIAVVLVSLHPNSSYGLQRMWSLASIGLFPLVAGAMVDASGKASEQDPSKFTSLFYMFDVVVVVVLFVVWFYIKPRESGQYDAVTTIDVIEIKTVEPVSANGVVVENKNSEDFADDVVETGMAESNLKALGLILLKPRAFVFVASILLLGILWGVVKVYVPWRMSDLGASQKLIGLGLTLSTVVGFPLVMFSDFLIRKFGHLAILVFVFATYVVRFVAYSLLVQPPLFLIFEALDGVTYHLMWVTSVTYATLLTPIEMVSTVQGFAASVHYCVGPGLSGIIAGTALTQFEAKATFLGFAISAAFGCLYLTAFTWYSSRRQTSRFQA